MIYKLGEHILAQGDSTDAEFVSRVMKGVTVRAVVCDPPYVVAPPSVHASGNSYEWIVPPDNTPFAEFPSLLIKQEQTLGVPSENSEHDWERKMGGVSEGERNSAATEIAGKLLAHIPADEWETIAWKLLCAWNDQNKPPIGDAELRAVFDSIARRQASKGNGPEDKKNQSELLIAIVESSGAVLFHREIDELIVINDEAHHVHDEKMAWFKSIQDIDNKLKQKGSGLALQLRAFKFPTVTCLRAIMRPKSRKSLNFRLAIGRTPSNMIRWPFFGHASNRS